MTHRRLIVPIALLLHAALPSISPGQTPEPCSYDSCALRLSTSFFSTKLVQGRDARQVASLGLFAPKVGLFAQRSDTAARYYASFRRGAGRASILGLVALGLVTAGTIVYEDDHDVGLVLLIGGGLIGIGGGVVRTRAQENLSRAVWWYNRTLTASP